MSEACWPDLDMAVGREHHFGNVFPSVRLGSQDCSLEGCFMKRLSLCLFVGIVFCLSLSLIRHSQSVAAAPAVSSAPATLQVSPTSLNFGSVPVYTESPPKTVHIKNVGTTTVQISGISIEGTDIGDFSQTHNCKSSLAAGASCSVNVTFAPTLSGTRTAELTITDNASGSPQNVGLVGTGYANLCRRLGQPCDPQPCCHPWYCVHTGDRGSCQ